MNEKAKVPFWKPALIYGAIVGFVSILLGIIFYIMGLTSAGWASWVSSLIGIIVLVYCLITYRKEYLGGFASYGQIFIMAVMIGIVATILSTIYSYVLMGIIDPDLIDKLRLVQEEKLMNNPRIPESMYESMSERFDKSFQLNRMLMMGMIIGPVIYTIFGLIAAAFIKKEETPVNSAI